MKKIFTLALALIGLAGAAKAANVDDIAVCKHSYVFVCDEVTNNGTVKPDKNTLVGNGFVLLFGSDAQKSVSNGKGSVDLSTVDGEIVTEDIAAKYAEYGKHLNSLRLKNLQDMFVMKLTAKSKLIIFFNGQNKTGAAARYPKIATDEKLENALNAGPTDDTPAVGVQRLEFVVPDDGTYYVGSYNGDIYVSYIIVEANEAPGTPTVKVGDQTYEGGLWFREVTCKANDATEEGSDEKIPTIVTYTTDGTMPTAASPVYTQPIKCYKDMTVKFQAFLDFGDGKANADFICDGADNEGIVSFSFDAPAIEADGATFTINSPYAEQNGTNFYKLNGGEEVQGNGTTLTESATVTAFTKIANGEYATFTSKSTLKDVYVLNPIKEKKVIAVTAGEAVLDEEATATSTTGEVYKVEGGEISAEKSDFFVKDLTFKAEKNADYQVPVGQEVYIQMSNTNITFFVAEGDSVDVKVICTKNSCKNIDADDAEDGSQVNDRKCFVNVSGTNYCLKDEEGNETNDLKLYPNANEFTFGLKGAEGGSYFTFQKYSGTGNIMISSIEFTPAAAEPETVDLIDRFTYCWNDAETQTHNADGSITFNAVQWGGLAAWIDNEDWSEYDKIIFEFAEPTPVATQVKVQYNSGNDTDTWINEGSTKAEGNLDATNKVSVKQVALQSSDAAVLTITKIYLVKGTSGIETIKAVNVKNGAIYNLAGQKVDANYKGVVIVNGKKMLQK